MARTKKKRWSYSAGERGRNRVRVFEHTSGRLKLEFRDNGKRTRISLGHRDRQRAKREADRASAKLVLADEVRHAEPVERALTLSELFDTYGREVTPTKGDRSRRHDARTSQTFLRYFGAERVVSRLTLQDWERFIQDRRVGRIGPGEGPWKPVRDRAVEYDLRFFMAVLNWATMAGDGRGGVLLERNPFKGFRMPKEKSPLRVKLTDEEYEALLEVSTRVDWRFHVALVLAHETGHRIGAIRKLLWSDVDLDKGLIAWRAETEKTGYAHVTPITGDAMSALKLGSTRASDVGDAPVLPSPMDPERPFSRHLARDWWKRAEKWAGLPPKRGRGWHSLRRKFASDLKGIPLKTLCGLGGWKSHHTVLICYQQVDQNEMREALETRETGTQWTH